ncbi:exosortase C-terminal domain/associated protein EpsI [Granulicella sp. dw_53]|uniref:exosortase C-terminal domain/associated protein EpsI n=1 Tax=Granulicella sp. dw_53 TaxID=2719792 RepID=UPI001BD3095F|nr:exosortase C-terminal domain/associated protein EpsI [Granulicella sp. dw_53]
MKSPRFWTVVLLLFCTALVLHSRGDSDKVPYSQPLSQLPQTIGPWTSRDLPMDDAVLAILGKGDFLNRIYTGPRTFVKRVSSTDAQSDGAAPVSLFIGYFPTQRTGQSIHSPQHCLPGAGWTFESSRYTNLTADDGKVYRVGEYVISDGTSRQFVLYWYQAHGRSIANEYTAKFYMIADAIRLNRTDGAIVRVISPVLPTEAVADARERVIRFTGQMAPSLPRFIPE